MFIKISVFGRNKRVNNMRLQIFDADAFIFTFKRRACNFVSVFIADYYVLMRTDKLASIQIGVFCYYRECKKQSGKYYQIP